MRSQIPPTRRRAGPIPTGIGLLLFLLAKLPAGAVDFSGTWADMYHEDQLERIPGPSLGDYLGIPINDDARFRADTWSASILTLPEHQCIPHPVVYSMRGPANLRIWNDIDPLSQELRAILIYGTFGRATRAIWMDGRPHPPEYAAHTWAGFSTGKWEGDVLTVETTHIKAGYIRRNGLMTTDRATVTEHFYRHDNILTVMSIRYDPAYLTEPFVQSENWVLDPNMQQIAGPKCESVEEIAGRKPGYVPHILPGENTALKEFPIKFGIPPEAARGGAETMYPEYRKKLKIAAGPGPSSGAK